MVVDLAKREVALQHSLPLYGLWLMHFLWQLLLSLSLLLLLLFTCLAFWERVRFTGPDVACIIILC